MVGRALIDGATGLASDRVSDVAAALNLAMAAHSTVVMSIPMNIELRLFWLIRLRCNERRGRSAQLDSALSLLGGL